MSGKKRPRALTGKRIGPRRSDRRWVTADGQVWASRFEAEIYDAVRRIEPAVRRCGQSDAVAYATPVRSGQCLECGGSECVQRRIYTPDLCIPARAAVEAGGRDLYIEVKGFFPAEKRSMFRHLRRQRPDLAIVFVLYANPRVGKSGRMTDYFKTYLPTVPVTVWQDEGIDGVRRVINERS